MKNNLKPPVSVIIVDDSRLPRCEGECGTDWSRKENLEAAGRSIAARFGPGVELRFGDLSRKESVPNVIERRLRTDGLTPPVLFIEGEPRLCGLFDVRMMCDLIEAQLEMNRA